MAAIQEENNVEVAVEEEEEISKAAVTIGGELPPTPAQFEEKDIVKLSVLENGVRTSKQMEVVAVVPVGGSKYCYKVRRPGDTGTYKNKNGNKNGDDLFKDEDLSFW